MMLNATKILLVDNEKATLDINIYNMKRGANQEAFTVTLAWTDNLILKQNREFILSFQKLIRCSTSSIL